MTYKIDEHTEFWGGAKHAAQTFKQGAAEFTQLPTGEEIRRDVAAWSDTQKCVLSDISVPRTGAQYTSSDDLRKQLAAWPSSQNINTCSKESDIRNSGKDIAKEAVKHDDGKPDWSLVPFESLEGMVKVLEFGAKKYAGWNWTTNGGFSYTRVLRSCLRHIFAYMRGEDIDPESGLSHIHHAMCNLLFISHYIGNKEKYNKDDRQVR